MILFNILIFINIYIYFYLYYNLLLKDIYKNIVIFFINELFIKKICKNNIYIKIKKKNSWSTRVGTNQYEFL